MTDRGQDVVLLHDWLTGFRGGERVLEAFAQMFPKAPLYTLIYKKGSTSEIIENRPITASLLNILPGIHRHYRKALPLFPWAVEHLKIKESPRLILSSSHCVIKGLKKSTGATHVAYIHSPMRYLYDQYDHYFGAHAPLWQQWGAKAFRNYLTRWDLASNDNVDLMVANSQFVRQRIKKFYQREALVVHPFVELEDFHSLTVNPPPREDFYLMVTAFAPNKKVDLAIEAFNQNGRRLKIVGQGQQEKLLRRMAGPRIEFLGNLERQEITQLYARARAFIFPGVEDFGITPLEAMAAGTPVIAQKIGGVLETLTEETAEFFITENITSLNQAIDRFESRRFDPRRIQSRAHYFTRDRFIKEMQKILSGYLS
jgi:glycosyltransferase involved in cell wall biosynthesis